MIRCSFKWLIPRLGMVLVVVSFLQLVAYMRGMPKTSSSTECPRTNIFIKKVIKERKILLNCTTSTTVNLKDELRKEKKHLAAKLRKLLFDLSDTQKDAVTLAPLYHRLGEHIKAVNEILHSLQEDKVELNEKYVQRNAKKPAKSVVCPEKFMGSDLSLGYPWFRTGFATLNCTDSVPMHRLITVILHYSRQLPPPLQSLFTVLRHIAKFYPGINVVLSSDKDQENLRKRSLESQLNISLSLKTFPTQNPGEMWNSLIDDINTPYVFLGSDVTHFTDDVNFERLIRVISTNKEVVIAGGSIRNQRGEWDIGCLQTVFRNWTMHYRGGYYGSFGDCIVCDHVQGPWVADTEKLKKLPFDQNLQYGVFHDFFFRLKTANPGSLAVTCPDVMFNFNTRKVDDESYVELAKKWDIKKWIESDGQVRWYGCRRGYRHNQGTSKCSLTKGLGNPPCELENLADAIKFIMRECEKAGLFCELQEGTLLGAVKFNKVLPWERDADITFLTANYTAFKKLRPKFIEQGYSLTDDDPSLWCCVDGRQAGGKFRVGTPGFTIEMYGQHMMESEILAARRQPSTKIHFAGEWVNVVRNPGLYARNRYGPNHFRHAEHWMDLGFETGWSFYKPSHFTPCPTPGHSACLDQYPADGNIQFSDYTTL